MRGLDHGEIQSIDDLGEVRGRTVYMLDFAFGPELTAALDERAAKLVVLDHHKSAAEKLTGFQCRCGVVHFDMHHSGARLAWEFFHPEKPVPRADSLHRRPRYLEVGICRKRGLLAALEMEPRELAALGRDCRVQP